MSLGARHGNPAVDSHQPERWFYCKDTSPDDENALPGFRSLRLGPNHHLPAKITATERKSLAPTLAKIKALVGNGLTGIDLVRFGSPGGLLR